jgi:hypothetical protein
MRNWSILVHGRAISIHELIRLTMAWTWGEATTFPIIFFVVITHGGCIQMSFCPQVGSREIPEILEIGTFGTLKACNFL